LKDESLSHYSFRNVLGIYKIELKEGDKIRRQFAKLLESTG